MNRVQTVTGTTNQITYTTITGAQYPAQITYNGHINGIAANNKIEFVLESTNRIDTRVAYNSAFKVETSRRLSKIYCKVGSTVIRRYDLTYTNSPSTRRSLLSSVKVYGLNEAESLPAVTFNYQQQVRQFQSATWTNLVTRWTNSGGSLTTPDGWTAPTAGSVEADLMDLDGDGLPDRVLRRPTGDSLHSHFLFQRNTGSAFAAIETNRWGPLTVQTGSGTIGAEEWDWIMGARTRMVDLNGDGRPDHVLDPIETFFNAPNTNYTHFVVDLNAGTGWSASNVWPNVTALYQLNTGVHRGVEVQGFTRLIDMNGDGLPDRVLHRTTLNPPYTNWWVQFNTTTNFTTTNLWKNVDCQGLTANETWGTIDSTEHTRLIDMNGDGLPDRVMAPYDTGTFQGIDYANFNRFVVQFNNGYGFENPINWTNIDMRADLPTGQSNNGWAYIDKEPDGLAMGTALRDINGDGLPDRILGKYTSPFTNYFVQFNTGTTFTPTGTNNLFVVGPPNSQGFPNDQNLSWLENANTTRFIDINGDGLSDRVMAHVSGSANSNFFVVDLSKGPLPDLLTTVSNGIGGSVSVTYKPSTSYNNRETSDPSSKGLLMFPVQTVASIAVSDGLYPAYTNSYGYEGGFYDPARREFAGFCCVSVTNALGQVTRHWFHQGGGRDNTSLGEFDDSGKFSKRGMRFRTEIVGTNSQTYGVTLNKVDQYVFGSTARRFPFIAQTIDMDYPGTGGPFRASASQFFFDTSNGNLTNTTEFGEVTNVVASTHAISNTSTGDDVYQITFFAALSNTDIIDKPLTGWVAADSGGSTLLRETINTYDGSTGNLLQRLQRICPGSYLTNRFSYDAFGNVYQATNAAGIVTTSSYDTTKTFPTEQIAATFTNSFIYDLNSGMLIWSKDPKNLVRSNAFDGFYRLLGTWVSDTPNGSPNVWLERYQYSLSGITSGSSANYVRLEKNDTTSANPANGHDTYTYMDGLARVVQICTESETNNYFRVTQKVFNEWGALKVETQPLFLTGTSYNVLNVTGTPCVFSEYDPIGRVKQTTAPMNANFAGGLLTGAPTAVTETGSLIGPLQMAYNDGNNPWAVVVTDEAGSASGLVRKGL